MRKKNRPILLIYKDAKPLNKRLASDINKHKNTLQPSWIILCQLICHHTNGIKEKNHMITSIDTEKYLKKFSIHKQLKVFGKLGIRTFLK